MNSILKNIKRFILLLTSHSYLKKDVSLRYTWYGEEFAGFYVCPGCLNSNSIVYSFGVGENISFDNRIVAEHGCKVYCFDPTPKSINWFKENNKSNQIILKPVGIGVETGVTEFYLPKNENHVSGSIHSEMNVETHVPIEVPMQSLEDILNELEHERIDVLKIDIEGSEYAVLDSILELDIEIGQILVEFHDRFFSDLKSKKTTELLREKGYLLFASSSSLEEISFIHKSLLNEK